MDKKGEISDRDQELLWLAEKLEGWILGGYCRKTSKEAITAATMLQLHFRTSDDDPEAMEKAVPLARELIDAWMKISEEERRRLCHGWKVPDPHKFPSAPELLRQQGTFTDDVDLFLQIECGADGHVSSRHRFLLSGPGTEPVQVLIRSGAEKRDVVEAMRGANYELGARWAELIAPGKDPDDCEGLPGWGGEKEPAATAGAGDSQYTARAALGELLALMGEQGEAIAKLVLKAVAEAPCELDIWTVEEPQEHVDGIKIDRPAWQVPGVEKKPSVSRRVARKLGSKGGKMGKQTA